MISKALMIKREGLQIKQNYYELAIKRNKNDLNNMNRDDNLQHSLATYREQAIDAPDPAVIEVITPTYKYLFSGSRTLKKGIAR